MHLDFHQAVVAAWHAYNDSPRGFRPPQGWEPRLWRSPCGLPAGGFQLPLQRLGRGSDVAEVPETSDAPDLRVLDSQLLLPKHSAQLDFEWTLKSPVGSPELVRRKRLLAPTRYLQTRMNFSRDGCFAERHSEARAHANELRCMV